MSAFPDMAVGVPPAHCPFRGLLSVHSRYGLHTRAVTVYRDMLSEGFSHFVTSMTAPVASGWSGRRWDLHPLESAALSRRTPTADIAHHARDAAKLSVALARPAACQRCVVDPL